MSERIFYEQFRNFVRFKSERRGGFAFLLFGEGVLERFYFGETILPFCRYFIAFFALALSVLWFLPARF